MSAGSSLRLSPVAWQKLQKKRYKKIRELQNLLLWVFFKSPLPVKPSKCLVLNTRVKANFKKALIITCPSTNTVGRILPETFWDGSWDSPLPSGTKFQILPAVEQGDLSLSNIYVQKACHPYTNKSLTGPFSGRIWRHNTTPWERKRHVSFGSS